MPSTHCAGRRADIDDAMKYLGDPRVAKYRLANWRASMNYLCAGQQKSRDWLVVVGELRMPTALYICMPFRFEASSPGFRQLAASSAAKRSKTASGLIFRTGPS